MVYLYLKCALEMIEKYLNFGIEVNYSVYYY